MMKLNILKMKNFLKVVNLCKGAVNMLDPDGKWFNISRQYTIQNDLLKQYKENGNCLWLTVDIKNPHDYMSIVSYYAGDC
ncbi:MAG: ribonuclease HII [Clostridium sp.]|nr:ribonuclease HII [Clostridium sp.]